MADQAICPVGPKRARFLRIDWTKEWVKSLSLVALVTLHECQ